jgi:hypothetical protein
VLRLFHQQGNVRLTLQPGRALIYLPMQKLENIRFRISSAVVAPVS